MDKNSINKSLSNISIVYMQDASDMDEFEENKDDPYFIEKRRQMEQRNKVKESSFVWSWNRLYGNQLSTGSTISWIGSTTA